MAEVGKKQVGLGLPGADAAQWPLLRYGRFMPLGTGEPAGPGLEAGMASPPTWKVRPEGRKGREASPARGWREDCVLPPYLTGGPECHGQEEGPPRDWQGWLADS